MFKKVKENGMKRNFKISCFPNLGEFPYPLQPWSKFQSVRVTRVMNATHRVMK